MPLQYKRLKMMVLEVPRDLYIMYVAHNMSHAVKRTGTQTFRKTMMEKGMKRYFSYGILNVSNIKLKQVKSFKL